MRLRELFRGVDQLGKIILRDYVDRPSNAGKTITGMNFDGLLDSGGDFIVIPLPIATYLDLKLKKAGDVDTAGGTTQLYKAKVDMSIVKKNKNTSEQTDYTNSEIHISARDDIPVLLGRNPIFEDYEITFKKKRNQLILKQAKK